MTRSMLALALLVVACGPMKVPEPTYGAQVLPDEQWVKELSSPPPSVQVEEIGTPPGPGFVWVDGQWAYQPLTKRWTWEQGAFCVPPPGAVYYARPAVAREREVVGRVKRWNEALSRFEEVDSGDDVWRWARGRFYVKDKDGNLRPSTVDSLCVAANGTGSAPAK